jgi:hypothetical protein
MKTIPSKSTANHQCIHSSTTNVPRWRSRSGKEMGFPCMPPGNTVNRKTNIDDDSRETNIDDDYYNKDK